MIRLNGRVQADFGAFFSSLNTGVNANGTPNGFKTNPVEISSYMRLYPGFDGMAANGLRYGASVELRENFQSGIANGFGTNGTTATSPSSNTSGQTVFVRRAFTYLANDRVGIVRLGQTDGVIGLFDNCIFTIGLLGRRCRQLQWRHPAGIWPPGCSYPVCLAGPGRRGIRQQQNRVSVAAVFRL